MKAFSGKIVSTKMQGTVVVEIEFFRKHPLYKKIMRRTQRLKADTNSVVVQLGDMVKIGETKPMSRHKHFKILEVIKK